RCNSALSIRDRSLGKRLPCALGGSLVKGFQFSRPVLNLVIHCIGTSPGNLNGIDVYLLAQVDQDPLRVRGIVLSSEGARQIWVTLPEAFRIAIRQSRPTVSIAHGIASTRKRISP